METTTTTIKVGDMETTTMEEEEGGDAADT